MRTQTNRRVTRSRLAPAVRRAVAVLIEPVEARVLMSAAGQTDTSFGNSGGVLTSNGTTPPGGSALAVQADGDLVVGRTVNGVHTVTRLTPAGKVDTTFGTNGSVTVAFDPAQVFVLPSGNLIVAGTSMTELTATGAVDAAYGTDGTVTPADAVGGAGHAAVAPDGSAYVLEDGGSTLARYTPDGQVDPNYYGGLLSAPHTAVAAAVITTNPLGDVVAAVDLYQADTGTRSYSLVTVDLNPNGGGNGTGPLGGLVSTAPITPTAVAVGADGTIYAAATQGATTVVAAVSAGGVPLATDALPAGSIVAGLAVQPDGKLVAAGSIAKTGGYADEFVARFEPTTITADGGPDLTFDGTGITKFDYTDDNHGDAVVVTPGGDVIAAGGSQTAGDDVYTVTALTGGPVSAAPAALVGTVIGTAGSYKGQGNTAANAFDGNPATFVDAYAASGSYAGLDLGAQQVVNEIAFAPRGGYASRMVGGVFQGSNSPTFSGAVTLYKVTAAPAAGLTDVAVTNTAGYRYVRYVGPNNGEGNLAEAQFFGTPALAVAAAGTAVLSAGVLTVTGTAGADVISLTGSDTVGGTTGPVGSFTVKINGVTTSFSNVAIRQVVVNAGAGNDQVTLGTTETGPATEYGGPSLAATVGLVVNGGDGNDTLSASVSAPTPFAYELLSVTGGAGDDVITTSGSEQAVLDGGDGNDTLTTADGANSAHFDTLIGGAGNDVLAPANDSIADVIGGTGTDTLDVGGAGTEANTDYVVNLDGTTSGFLGGAGYSHLNSDIENVTVRTYDSTVTVTGSAAANVITIADPGGNATLDGGAGNDTFFANDGGATTIDGGPGTDAATIDPTGDTTTNVESVTKKASGVNPIRLAGTTFGTAGSYADDGDTIADATDGNLSTFFDAPTAGGAFVGIDLGSAQAVKQIGFAARAGFETRMAGGYFQASNDATFATGTVEAYYESGTVASGKLTLVAPSTTAAYRYWRYVSPPNGYCNIAEFELFAT